jgi:threonine/homoserine/homoserine lactone efflux protein
MGSVWVVAGVFIILGLVCMLAPEQVAELGVRLDFTNQAAGRRILKRYARATRWSGRIVGGLLVLAGVLILIASSQ